MSVNKTLCFMLLKCCFVLMCNAEIDYFKSSTWSASDDLDPHSFYYDKHTKTETLPDEDNDGHEIGEFGGGDVSNCYKQLRKCKLAQNTDVADELLSRRIVNILVSRATFKKDGSYISGRIDLEATESQLEDLRNFGLGKLTLREIDPILNKVVQTPAFDAIHESVIRIRFAASFLWDLLFHTRDLLLQHKQIVGGALAMLFLYFTLRTTRYNFWIVMTLGIQLILVVSFFITWWKLIQEEQIKHAAKQMKHMELPIRCQPHKMGWFDRWFSKSDDCEKYHEAMMLDPILQVTPAQALAHMLANVVFEPVALSGKTIANFLQALTGNMPWLISSIIQVAFCLGFFPILILFIILLCGGTLNLGFGPFSMVSLSGRSQPSAPRQSLESKNKRQPIEVMLNVTNVQDSPAILDTPARLNNPSITACPECCEKSKKKSISPQKTIRDDKACEDSESTNGPGSSKDSDDAEVKARVQERKVMEMGSGDSELTNGPGSSKDSNYAEVKARVQERLATEMGSGDHNFILE